MSATAAAALKKVAVAVLTDPKARKKVGFILLVVLLVCFLPVAAVLALLSGQIQFDSDQLQTIVISNLSEEKQGHMKMQDEVTAELERRMLDEGYHDTQVQKAKLLYALALYSYGESVGFTDQLIGCFADGQTDHALIDAVNTSFGTQINADTFIMICQHMLHPIVSVAKAQVGNEGGETFWRWYGFEERVDWCACFVSWCADQCGYIDAGTAPLFSVCQNGLDWYKDHDQWLDGAETPSVGMIVFFDWDRKGKSGPQDGRADHVGIVEKVENGIVYTIEGNSGDACRQKQYAVGHYEILGYGFYQNKDERTDQA